MIDENELRNEILDVYTDCMDENDETHISSSRLYKDGFGAGIRVALDAICRVELLHAMSQTIESPIMPGDIMFTLDGSEVVPVSVDRIVIDRSGVSKIFVRRLTSNGNEDGQAEEAHRYRFVDRTIFYTEEEARFALENLYAGFYSGTPARSRFPEKAGDKEADDAES